MSRTITTLIIKFIMTFIFAAIAFAFLKNPFSWAFIVALLVTVVNYIVGDLLVLPTYGNAIASIGDGVMAAIVAYIVDLFTIKFLTSLPTLILFAFLVGVGEYFFHRYLDDTEEVAP